MDEPKTQLKDGATILVVDDYPIIAQSVAKALGLRGHRSLIARDGVEAQEVLATNGTAIDLVITDIEMPRMRGDDLACWLMSEHPRTSILLMSSTLPHREEARALPLLEKPFTMKMLIATVERILGRSDGDESLA
ncbi:MAG: response regulator [Chthoniobacteraceae bacterium]